MKAAACDYVRPATLAEALDLLATERAAKPLAGGQSLGPLLNLRLAQPALLVDIAGIEEMTGCWQDGETVVLGACVTHAAIEDRRTPDPGGDILPGVARGIAYRAVRNRGTVGGSLAHADPAADWPTVLLALGAEVRLASRGGERTLPLDDFLDGAFEPKLRPGELLTQVRVPPVSPDTRWGYAKVCRKTGEYAHAMAAVLNDPERGVARAVLGATDSRPLAMDAKALLADPGAAEALVATSLPHLSPLERRQQTVALMRAGRQAA